MEKTWMLADRRSSKFQTGFENFLKFASTNVADKSSIRCPCMKCCNHSGFTVAVIKDHVYFNGIMTNYKNWDCHGEAAAMEGDSGGDSESVDKPEDIEGEENKGEEDEDEEMSFPTRFSSNISNLVSMEDLKLVGLKSHDCHTVMQYLLPVALRSVLEKPVREVEWCGPVFFRWMFPFERYMKVLKGYVKNRHFPEGCMAEKYIVEEAVEYLEERIHSEGGITVGIPSTSIAGNYKQSRPLSRPTIIPVYGKQMHLAHLCVLQNTEDVQPYIKEHNEYLELIYPNNVKNKKWMREKHNATFPDWLKERVANQLRLKSDKVSQTLRWMAAGPKNQVPTYAAYHVNGVDYNTKVRDGVRSFQNSSVTLLANAMQVSSARDQNPSDGAMDFYGVIRSIWEVDYYKFRVHVFHCDWVESTRAVKVDKLGFTLVKLNRLGHLNDPFVLATHVKQIFYIEDPLDAEWSVVVRCPDIDYHGVDDDDEVEDTDEQSFIPAMPSVDTFDDIDENHPTRHMRDGNEGIWINNSSLPGHVMAPARKGLNSLGSKKGQKKRAAAEVIASRIKATRQKPATDISGTATLDSGKTLCTSPQADATLEKNATPSDEAVSALKKMKYSRKAKSNSVSTSAKPIRKKKEQIPHAETPNITGGLRLLSRPKVTMARVTKRLIRGIKLPIESDDRGTPIGKNAADMQSYIGVLERTTIPIIFDDWRNVDDEPKEKIWEAIQEAYVIPQQCRRFVLKSASTKWREFKSTLTTHYVMPFKDSPEKLENPPDDYRCIPKLHWSLFVEDRISEEFKELREVQSAKRKLNKYNHRMSRKGYAQSRVELAKKLGVPIEMLDRATMWLNAHSDKDGNFSSPEETLKKQASEGSLTTLGSTDVLTLALKKPEHPGRVRGVGGFVRPDVIFDLPIKRKRGGGSQATRKSIRLILEEEQEEFMAEQKAKWEEESEKRIQKLDEKWKAQFESLLGRLQSTDVQIPAPVTPVNELNSGNGSCNPNFEKVQMATEINADLSSVKKRLNLDAEKFVEDAIDPKHEVPDPKQNEETTMDLDEVIHFAPKAANHITLDLTCDENECRLAVDTVENIVAIAKVIDVGGESSNQLLHGVPLGENNMRVSVIRAIEGDALVPIPVRDEILTVDDAVGSCVAWPKDLVVTHGAKAVTATTETKENEDLDNLPPNLPKALLDLCNWANTFLKEGKTVNTVFQADLFGHPKKAYICRADVYSIAHKKEVSNSALFFYMSYLNKVLKQKKMEDMIRFVDSDKVSAIGSGTPTARSRDLSVMYKNRKPGQIYLIPYNTGQHWTLTIVNPELETARYMDPLKRRLDGTMKMLTIIFSVGSSIKMYTDLLRKQPGKKKASPWKPLLGAPIQKDDVSCGYYVMRYMKEIVEDNNIDLDKKWGTRASLTYTAEEIDEIRGEWAEHVLQFPDQ
ncbi:hypothetical protein ACLB2K_004829 [Fragaria x ananassa]